MRFFKGERDSELFTAKPAPPRSWTSRLNPFRRSKGPSSPISSMDDGFPITPLSTTPVTTPALSEASSPISDYGSRRSSSVFSVMTPDSAAPPIPPKSLDRQTSVYSHRSLSIRRDSSRPPPAIPRAQIAARPATAVPKVNEEDCLILTATSKYPSGVLGDIYVPEDCSFEAAKKRKHEDRKAHFRNQITRNGALIRRHSGIKSSEERWRQQRCSLNF